MRDDYRTATYGGRAFLIFQQGIATVRHVLGLYHGRPRARAFRRRLSELAPREGAGVEVLLDAIRIAEGEAAAALAAAE